MVGYLLVLFYLVLSVAIVVFLSVAIVVLLPRYNAIPQQAPALQNKVVDFKPYFFVAPYLQLGYRNKPNDNSSLSIIWFMTNKFELSFRYKINSNSNWHLIDVSAIEINAPGHTPKYEYTASLRKLPNDCTFTYQIIEGNSIIFEAKAKGHKGINSPYKLVVFGDLGSFSEGKSQIASLVHEENPDIIVMPGDIVYGGGTVAQYPERFFPFYNSDNAVLNIGAPIMRSILAVSSVGNHDLGKRGNEDAIDFSKHPDLLGYFYFWKQPLNGPDNHRATHIVLDGDLSTQEQFLKETAHCFPRMTNFSFDFGNAHWTILDSNLYSNWNVDWHNSILREWLENDLANAQNATWRFVAFHHPSFYSDLNHPNEENMRVLSPIFESGNVDIVFSGHAHCYERSFPLKFKPDNELATASVPGKFIIDKNYDGNTQIKPKGIIYIVTGGGGAKTYPESAPTTDQWQPFTCKYFVDDHSFTACNINNRRLTARQITAAGIEIDRFVIEK
jgi:3',5'-cyclic AMP phosphodiesterase CpdA